MGLVKQRNPRDRALCVAAMLTGRSYEQVLADNPDFENKTDEAWIEYSGVPAEKFGEHV